jgi:hypothetical protein
VDCETCQSNDGQNILGKRIYKAFYFPESHQWIRTVEPSAALSPQSTVFTARQRASSAVTSNHGHVKKNLSGYLFPLCLVISKTTTFPKKRAQNTECALPFPLQILLQIPSL